MADKSTKEYTPVQAIREFFGMRPHETLGEFMQELKALSPEDKKWMAQEAVKQLGGTLKATV